MRLRATALASVANRAFLRGTVGLLPLDTLDAAAAYSLRRLRTAYTGAAVRVRRSSDNVETDIGFTSGGALDEVALLAHVGAGNGFVTVWYDQSGNARNAAQATAASQPRIVNAGVVDLLNGKPAINFDGSSDFFELSSGILLDDNFTYVYSVLERATTGRHTVDVGRTTTPVGYGNWWFSDNVLYSNLRGSSFMVHGSSTATGTFINGLVRNNSGTQAYRNGTAFGGPQGALVTGNVTLNAVGRAQGSNAAVHNGIMAEVIVGRSNLSTDDRQALERNQGTYYGITVS